MHMHSYTDEWVLANRGQITTTTTTTTTTTHSLSKGGELSDHMFCPFDLVLLKSQPQHQPHLSIVLQVLQLLRLLHSWRLQTCVHTEEYKGEGEEHGEEGMGTGEEGGRGKDVLSCVHGRPSISSLSLHREWLYVACHSTFPGTWLLMSTWVHVPGSSWQPHVCCQPTSIWWHQEYSSEAAG